MIEISSFEKISFDGIPGNCNSSESCDSEEEGNVRKSTSRKEDREEIGDTDSLSSESGFDEDSTTEVGFPDSENKKERKRMSQTDYINLDGVSLSVFSPRLQSSFNKEKTKIANISDEEELQLSEFMKLRPPLDTPFPSLGILKNFESRLTRKEIRLPSSYTECKISQKLSTGEILRVAGEKFIQSSSLKVDDLSIPSHPSGHYSFVGLSEDEKLDVELVQNLLASAEKIGQQNYKSACTILSHCDAVASKTGNPVQRLVYYYSEALREKINRETGKTTSSGLNRKHSLENEDAMMILNPVAVAFDEQLPHCQLCIYTAMQAITENVSEAKKVHVVDLEIRSGLQYTVLMQALAARSEDPIELLKITAVGSKSKETIAKTGEWLMSFARSMNLPFSFNVVMVSDMFDLKQDLFEVEDDETVAIYSSFALRAIIGKPDRLESLMRVLRSINPCIMVLTEVEANHTSPVFVKRFTESLFFFGAYFDCMADCMDPNGPHRNLAETMYFGPGIRNLIAAESGERTFRHVTISVWRVFFARFLMVEEKLSASSLYQASLLLNKFSCWSSCSLIMDNKSLAIGWKGTPQISVSAWKFLKK